MPKVGGVVVWSKVSISSLRSASSSDERKKPKNAITIADHRSW